MKTIGYASAIATAASLLLGACAGADPALTAPLEVAPNSAGMAAKPGLPTPVAVTVQNAGPLGPYRIQSDGLGEYVNGLQGMLAEFDDPGNLQFSPENGRSTTPPQRTLALDYSAPTDPLNTYRPNPTGQWNFKIKTGNAGKPRIQDLGVNGNPVSECYATTVAHADRITSQVVRFNATPSANAYITRTSVSPATWTMVSDGPCTGNANWGGLTSQDLIAKNAPFIFRGYYSLQFSLLLRGL